MLKVLIFFIFSGIFTFGTYADEAMTEIKLPAPRLKGGMSFEEAVAQRRSVRSYKPDALTMEEIAQLLWSGQGITASGGRRASPSAGASYPLTLYIFKDDGLFVYAPENNSLVTVKKGDVRGELATACLGQKFVAEAPIAIVITAVSDRVTRRYKERGLRYADMEVGHAAQNIHLQAVALGLASVPVGAFDDAEVSRILALDDGESPVYVIPVGHEKK